MATASECIPGCPLCERGLHIDVEGVVTVWSAGERDRHRWN